MVCRLSSGLIKNARSKICTKTQTAGSPAVLIRTDLRTGTFPNLAPIINPDKFFVNKNFYASLLPLILFFVLAVLPIKARANAADSANINVCFLLL